ncbi:transglycosylase SLT domain-containing protein [Solimicrobium silvestre]|nr:transglycosylase SLT domain-containing protein [Solimicrobium silvestre]
MSLSGLSYAEPVLVASNTVTKEISIPEAIPAATNLHSLAFKPDDSPEIQEADLWNRIRQGYGIPNLDNSLVTSQLNWYSARTDYILRTTERASRYLYHVVEELEKRGMPTELALLPFIESAFNPQAMSTAKASGMWQFIPSTGRDFNLKQNMFKDERRGVLDSTDAALNYLQKLYDMFGDWQLALAAYNWGEGSVQRAIKKQQAAGLPIDFDSMSYLMPKETQNYVPKLQAVKNIISNPEFFNIALPKVDNQPYFASVDKTRDIDVRVAAQLAELTVAEFKQLNPQFNRPVITGNADTKILLPADNVEIYKYNLSKWEGPLSSWTAYTVGKNERIESIARRVGAQASVLKDVNQVPSNMMVKAGSTLLIPKSSQSADNDISQRVVDNASLTMTHDNTRKINVTASKKDSLTALAKRYKVSTAQIKEWNNLKSDTLKTGQKLQIEVAAAPSRRKNTRVAAISTPKKAIAVNKQTKKITVAQNKTHKQPG